MAIDEMAEAIRSPAPTCASCRWWGVLAPWEQGGHRGDRMCCRYPTRVVRCADDWCGEHAPKGGDDG